jgi:hypothetical protein
MGESITSLTYDRNAMTLSYQTPSGETTVLSLGASSSDSNTSGGMLSKTEYLEFKKLSKALDGITDVK